MSLRRFVRRMLRLGWRDPTAGFAPLAASPAFVYDVPSATMNGISYATPVGGLAHLGPASEAEGDKSGLELQYDHLGLLVDLDEAGVVSFRIALVADRPFAFGPVDACPFLTIALADRVVVAASGTTAAMLDDMLGPPYDRFRFDNAELCSQYAIDGSHFIATHAGDGQSLLDLEISESSSDSPSSEAGSAGA